MEENEMPLITELRTAFKGGGHLPGLLDVEYSPHYRDHRGPPGLRHGVLLVRSLAELHAAGLSILRSHPNSLDRIFNSQHSQTSPVSAESLTTSSQMSPASHDSLNTHRQMSLVSPESLTARLDVLVSFLSGVSGQEEIIRRVLDLRCLAYDLMVETDRVLSSDTTLQTLCNCRVVRSNVFYRGDGGGVLLRTWAASRLCSCVLDLAQSIVYTAETSHGETMIEAYIDQFLETQKRLFGSDDETPDFFVDSDRIRDELNAAFTWMFFELVHHFSSGDLLVDDVGVYTAWGTRWLVDRLQFLVENNALGGFFII